MCWVSYCINNMNKHIAKKDIYVYKVAMRVGCDMAIAPFYRKFSYTLGVTYGKLKSLEPVYYPHDECIINEGFHSYRTVERLLKNGKYFKDHPNYRSLAIYKAAIPTGAEYYVNEKGEVVSNQLKIIESLTFLNEIL